MDDAVKQKIKQIVGDRGVIEGADLAQRPTDPWGASSCNAWLLARPASTEELSQVMKICFEHDVPVVTHGGITGLAGGAKTSEDSIVISLERMNRIEEIDVEQRTMQVQGGAVLQAVQERAEAEGLMYPVDWGARGSATIGGSIATNAGGNRVLRYGMTRESVLGLEVVLADGSIMTSLSKVLKNNAGYNMSQLFIGSEGTLGIVTRAELRLRPKPSGEATALVAVDDFGKLSKLLGAAEVEMAGTLSSFEVMWHSFYKIVTDSPKHTAPLAADYPYYVIIESLGKSDDIEMEKLQGFLEKAFEDELVIDAVLAQSLSDKAKIWEIRDDVETPMQLGPVCLFDISVPIPRMSEYLSRIQGELDNRWPGNQLVVVGHLGDSNIHLGVATGSAEDKPAVEEVVYSALDGLGGSVSAEHGIGLEKRKFLQYSKSDVEIDLMRSIKRTLDPKNLLNPGKVFL